MLAQEVQYSLLQKKCLAQDSIELERRIVLKSLHHRVPPKGKQHEMG
jgi:hypothetical protein